MLVRNRSFSLRGLAAVPGAPPNPYATGVRVAGTGSSAPWPVTHYYPELGVWVANTGFGFAPIYRPEQYLQLVDRTIPDWALRLRGPSNEVFGGTNAVLDDGSIVPPSPYGLAVTDNMGTLGAQRTVNYGPGDPLIIRTADGGSQRIDYRFDGTYWVPSAAQGIGKPGTSWFDTLVQMGALVGTVAISAGGAAGLLGPSSAGIGAEAIGGSAAAVSTAAPAVVVAAPAAVLDVASTTAPEITGFTVPGLAPAVQIDASIAPLSISQAAVAAATSPLTAAFSVVKYVNTAAGLYKSVTSLTSPPRAAGPHPQAGTVTQLPDGSRSVVNPDGTLTVYDPTGVPVTVGWGGTVAQGSWQAPATLAAGAGWLLGLTALGMLFAR